jgi:diguanylate cyclase (GGDEF)-like protein
MFINISSIERVTMAKLQSETGKLSLVAGQAQAEVFNEPQQQESLEDIAIRLPAILQTSLELEEVVNLFHIQASKVLDYDSLHFLHQAAQCDINTGKRSHHSCNYRLEINGSWLGELTLTRRTKFSEIDTQQLEDLLCKLIYPLRNCLLFRQAQSAALKDALTGLNNRAAFDTSLSREIDLSQRQHSPLSLIVMDIDHFKSVNDTYGHSSGDLALQTLASTIIETLRASDIAFRYGGEEFTLVLSNTDLQAAKLVAERIRVAVSQVLCSDGQRSFGFTVSLGIAQWTRGENSQTFFDRSDRALYRAKKAGRNQTVCSENTVSKESH